MIELTIPEHSAAGGPTHATGLKRLAGKLIALPCGCQSDDTRWVRLCGAVFAELTRVRTLARTARVPTPQPHAFEELDIAAEIRALEQLSR